MPRCRCLVAATLVAACPALPAGASPVHVPRPVEELLEHRRPTRLPVHLEDQRAPELPLDGRHPLLVRARQRGSGTALLPATSPLRAWPSRSGPWLWLLQANVVYGSAQQGGSQGQAGPVAENWQQLMGTLRLGPGLMDVLVGTSLEPWTVGAAGTPQLFQAGQAHLGRPLVDRRHPLDLLTELAGRYTLDLGDLAALHLYGGLVGEPALGPVVAHRRPSAADNAWAPLASGLQDAAHLSQGVVTGGVRLGPVTLEGSAFNAREPDEDRVGLSPGPLDSFAARLGWAPDPRLALQLSSGLLRQVSARLPAEVLRTTASATLVQPLPAGAWSTTLAWGRQEAPSGAAPARQGLGLESQYDLGATHVYGRAEWLDRPALGLSGQPATGQVGAFTLGLARDLEFFEGVSLALGADATTYSLDADTRAAYGAAPLSWRAYVRLRPPTVGP